MIFDEVTDECDRFVETEPVHIHNQVVELGLFIVESAEVAIEMEPPFGVFFDHDLGLLLIEIVLLHDKFDAVIQTSN